MGGTGIIGVVWGFHRKNWLKIYASRQTISNWETEKNYPDIHSLLLLGTLFNVSLDQLIKGDVEIVKKEIKETEIRKLNRYAGSYGVLLVLTVISVSPLISWMGVYAFIPWGVLLGITMYFAFKVEKVKKDHDCRIMIYYKKWKSSGCRLPSTKWRKEAFVKKLRLVYQEKRGNKYAIICGFLYEETGKIPYVPAL